MTSFALHCNICPKRPDFSDLSHLLTHVGSKGHLSHYFKAQVRSRQEPSVREQLRRYDQWYKENQLEKLLSQRLILKESKSVNNRIRATDKIQLRSKNMARTTASDTVSVASSSTVGKDETVIDPQLSHNFFASPPLPPQPTSLRLPAEALSGNRAQIARMRNYGTSPDMNGLAAVPKSVIEPNFGPIKSKALQETGKVTDSESGSESPVKTQYPEPPAILQPFPILPNRSIQSFLVRDNAAQGGEDNQVDVEEDDIEELEDIVSECTKLKGICWPGMNIFDSASPEARRKRNQKKDGSILQQMKANSATVEPTELIFYSGGTLKKSRQITGQVESSPIKEITPKPKRQRLKPKKVVLSSISGNARRPRRRAHSIKTNQGIVDSIGNSFQDTSSETLVSKDTLLTRGYHTTSHQSSTLDDEEIDWALLMGDLPYGSKRRGFEIYGDEHHKMQGSSYARPVNHSPTASYPFLQERQNATHAYPPPHGLPYPHAEFSNPRLTTSPPALHSMGSRPGESRGIFSGRHREQLSSRTIDNKENVMPILDETGRIDSSAAPSGMRRNAQLYMSTHRSQPPHCYTNSPPSHMRFAALQPSQSHGYSMNPLAYSYGAPHIPPFPQHHQWSSLESFDHMVIPSIKSSDAEGLSLVQNDDSGDETIDERSDHELMVLDEEE